MNNPGYVGESPGKLIILSGGLSGQVVQLPPAPASLTLGRDGRCDVAFDRNKDIYVSRQHARIDIGFNGVVITDLDSRTGTFVDNQPIHTPKPLEHGDRITLGDGGPILTLVLDTPVAAAVDSTAVLTPQSVAPGRGGARSSTPNLAGAMPPPSQGRAAQLGRQTPQPPPPRPSPPRQPAADLQAWTDAQPQNPWAGPQESTIQVPNPYANPQGGQPPMPGRQAHPGQQAYGQQAYGQPQRGYAQPQPQAYNPPAPQPYAQPPAPQQGYGQPYQPPPRPEQLGEWGAEAPPASWGDPAGMMPPPGQRAQQRPGIGAAPAWAEPSVDQSISLRRPPPRWEQDDDWDEPPPRERRSRQASQPEGDAPAKDAGPGLLAALRTPSRALVAQVVVYSLIFTLASAIGIAVITLGGDDEPVATTER